MIASYAAQIYVALASIVTLPVYLHFMGSEAYGLVAVFVMLQGWLQLLDMGLSPTLARETARLRAGAVAGADVRRLLHRLEAVFAAIAIALALGVNLSASWLATHWLHLEQLPVATVATCLALMAPALALRLCSGLYRGAVSGLERIVWLSGFNIGIATMRYALVIPWLLFVSPGPIGFFAFQLAVAVVEIVVLRVQCTRLLRDGSHPHAPNAPPRSLRTILWFSLSIGFVGSLWSLITQVDKLLLSKLLPLADFGYFSLAVVAASGVGLAAGPITQALSPRLVHLHAAGQQRELFALYRRATELIAVIVAATATILICFPEAVLWVWTGRDDLARRTAPTLALYAAGNGVNAVTSMTFFLQYALGDLRLQVRGLILMLLILLPSLLWATMRYGMAGAGGAWFGVNLAYLLIWTAVIHHRLAPGLHRAWLFGDVARILVPTLLFGLAMRSVWTLPATRMPLALALVAMGIATLAVALAAAPSARALAFGWWRARRAA